MPGTLKKCRIFVVDDEHMISSTLALILRHRGFDATSFTEPLKALQAIQTDAPDLLISDIGMPQLCGIDLAIQVQKHCPECKVFLFSGRSSTDDTLEAARAEGYDFDLLSKPVHPSDILKKIEERFAVAV